MPRFCANLTMLWNELDFMDRFAAAAKAGFQGVEYLFPYDYDKNQIAELLRRHKLTQVLHNFPAGNWAKGERGIGCHPDRVGEFRDGVGKAIEYATALGCKQLNCLAGIAPAGVAPEKVRETFVSNLKLIPHMQLADNPGRNEPGTGEINYPFLFEHMDQVGYAGWVGCEYKPKTTTDAGPGWVKPYL